MLIRRQWAGAIELSQPEKREAGPSLLKPRCPAQPLQGQKKVSVYTKNEIPNIPHLLGLPGLG